MLVDIYQLFADADYSCSSAGPQFSATPSFLELLYERLEQGEESIARVPPLLCVRWHLRVVLETAKARRDAAGLAAALPHMLSVRDYATDPQYTSYWQGYGMSPEDLWADELLVDSQEDDPWTADQVLESAYFSLLPHYGFYGQDKRLIKGTTLKRLLAEVDKALGLTEQHEAITSAQKSAYEALTQGSGNDLDTFMQRIKEVASVKGEWKRVVTWAKDAQRTLPDSWVRLRGKTKPTDQEAITALQQTYSEFLPPKGAAARTRVRGTDRVGPPDRHTAQRQAGIGAGGGNGALPDRRAQGGPRAAEPQQEISSDLNDDLDDYQSAEEGSPRTSPDDKLPQGKGPHVHKSVAAEVVDLVSGEGDEEPTRQHTRQTQAQADDDQVQIAGPSHAPQHHTSATKRGATNTTHAPQPAAKRARNDAAAVAAGPSRPAPHQPAAAAHPDAIEIDSDADDGQNDNNPNNPKNNPQQRQQAGGTPGKGVRVLPASLIPEGAGPPSPRVGLDDSDGVERGPTGRRVGVPWTAEETKELIELWVRLGRQGKWVKIKEIDAANKKLLSRRTPGDLKDKIANLKKAGVLPHE